MCARFLDRARVLLTRNELITTPKDLHTTNIPPEKLSRELALCSTEESRALIPFELAQRYCFLPLGIHLYGNERVLSGVFADPINNGAISAIRFAAGIEVSTEVAPQEILTQAIHLAYYGSSQSLLDATAHSNSAAENSISKKDSSVEEALQTQINQAAAPQLLERIIDRALYLNASDVHLEPKGRSTRVRFRIDGRLREESSFSLTSTATQALSRRIKVVSGMELTGVVLPQEGAFCLNSGGWNLRVRVSIIPQLAAEKSAEKIVLRLLYNPFLERLLSKPEDAFKEMGMDERQEQMLHAFLALDHGALLVSGPTGSGKSTLLYAILKQLTTEEVNTITLEDPVERIIPGANQIEISANNDLNYSEVLPRLLRQDPDILMIGEIRDPETAQTALGASLTGSFVLSTIHSANCLQTFSRLSHLGVSSTLLAATLKLLISQRLIGKNCLNCIQRNPPNAPLAKLFALDPKDELTSSIGCSKCNFSSIDGRKAVFELLPISGAMKRYLENYGNVSRVDTMSNFNQELAKIAFNSGYRPYVYSVREALTQGTISPRSALKAVGINPHILGY